MFRNLLLAALAALALAGCAAEPPEPRLAPGHSAAAIAAVRLDPAAAVVDAQRLLSRRQGAEAGAARSGA